MSAAGGIGLVAGLLAGLMLAVRAGQQRGAIGAELARKLVHMGMGAVCLAFPWIFSSPEPVWLLATVTAGALLSVRHVPALKARLGGVLGSVERNSLGEVYFPFAVAAVFALARGDRAAFCAPVAVLAFADAAGALVGQRWGRLRYRAVESMKTVEGSAAVFVVTWVAVMLALALRGGVPPVELVLTGAIMGAFAALVEAVSWRGLDNLLVPLVAWVQLRIYPQLAWPDMLARLAVMAVIVVMMINWRSRLLDGSARIGAALVLYLFWSLGGWAWLVAPLALLASYSRLMPTVPGGAGRHHLAAVVCIGSAGLGWVAVNALSPAVRWLWLFTVGLATQQAIIAAVRFSQGRPHWRPWQWWTVAAVQAVGVQGLAFLAANGIAAVAWRDFAAGGVAVAAALAGFMAWDRELALPEDINARWWRQGTTAVLASLGALGIMQL